MTAMEIPNPRRVLAVCLEDSTLHLTRVIKELTGSSPQQTSTSLAGTTHNLALKTQYYTAEVPIWIDLIDSPEEWAEYFLSPEAKEVLEVLGGLIVVFALPPPTPSSSTTATTTTTTTSETTSSTTTTGQEPEKKESSDAKIDSTEAPLPKVPSAVQTRELLTQIGRVVSEGLGGWTWDGVSLCLGVGENDDVDEWEELAAGAGLEFVQIKKGKVVTRNEFGEKTGIPRVLEALESNDWTGEGGEGGFDPDDLEDSDFGDFEDGDSLDKYGRPTRNKKDVDIDPESLDFGFDKADFEGLKAAIWTSGQEVEDLPTEASASGDASTGARAEEPGAGTEKIDDEEVEKIERMMMKLSAVRDMAAGLPEDQRRKMAAKAVNEVMKEL